MWKTHMRLELLKTCLTIFSCTLQKTQENSMQTPPNEKQESNPQPSVCGFCAPNTETTQASHLPKDMTRSARLHTETKFPTYAGSEGE